MENNPILTRLMADGQENLVVPITTPQDSLLLDEDLSLSTSRVEAVRYRILSFIFIVLGIALFLYLILPSWDSLKGLRSDVNVKEKTIEEFTVKKQGFENDLAFITLIQNSEKAVADCVNERIACADLDQKIKDNFPLVRSFLLLTDLHDTKMEINEKTLLKNINEYLLGKSDSILHNISFGKSELVEGNLYSIPIQLRVEFTNKDKLFAFIDRVDKQVPNVESIRVLYKLDEVMYDIMRYNESQIVELSLQAFYYQQ